MEPVRSAVVRELARFGPASGLAPIVDRWPMAVGVEIARNAWPGRLARDGTLHVHTSSSAWAFELGHLATRIRSSLGDVAPAKLRFAVGALPEPAPAAEDARRPPVEPSAADLDLAREMAEPIADENLRKVVAKAAALSLASAADGRSLW
jgi:Dna[CI] antecedent, DciA